MLGLLFLILVLIIFCKIFTKKIKKKENFCYSLNKTKKKINVGTFSDYIPLINHLLL